MSAIRSTPTIHQPIQTAMFEGERPSPADVATRSVVGASEPRRNWLSRILQKGPEARRRLGNAVAGLLGTALVSLAALGGAPDLAPGARGDVCFGSVWGRPASSDCQKCPGSRWIFMTRPTMKLRPRSAPQGFRGIPPCVPAATMGGGRRHGRLRHRKRCATIPVWGFPSLGRRSERPVLATGSSG